MKVQHIDPENGIIKPITINVIRWKYETMHEMYDVLSDDEYFMWGWCITSKIRADLLMRVMLIMEFKNKPRGLRSGIALIDDYRELSQEDKELIKNLNLGDNK
jgi:hypothetical protein